MPRKAAALPRIEAPSTISAIIEQVSTDPIATSRSACSVSPPCSQATISAPSTPPAAPSDGVAMPPYIEPSTATMRKIAGPRSFSARKRSDQGTSRSAAPAAGPRAPGPARRAAPGGGGGPAPARGVYNYPAQEGGGKNPPGEKAPGENLR